MTTADGGTVPEPRAIRTAPTKNARHRQIVDILRRTPVRSQVELGALLAEDGLVATQATLSRDLVELGAVKVRHSDGTLVYAVPGEGGDRTGVRRRMSTICRCRAFFVGAVRIARGEPSAAAVTTTAPAAR